MGTIREKGGLLLMTVRLRVQLGRITEIETSYFRAGGGGPNNIAAMDNQGQPEALCLQLIPPAQRASRQQLVAIAGSRVAHRASTSLRRFDREQPDPPRGDDRYERTAGQTGLPWDIAASLNAAGGESAEFALRRRLLVAGFVLLAGMALSASYLIIRAVSRELAVARLQSDFVAAVSHEFRAPLTALRQFTDMLRENERFAPDNGKERRLLCYDAQARATDRLTKLVESLLDFGRMEAGARRYKFERRDCAEFVSHVVEDFRGEAQADGYTVEFCGNGSVSIDADSEALGRAVWNLMDNAAKYSPDHRSIEVAVHRDGDNVRIGVRDHGIGIPDHERAAIFAKFQRGEQARIRGIKGTGIGLTMANEIVQAHRGRIQTKGEYTKTPVAPRAIGSGRCGWNYSRARISVPHAVWVESFAVQ
jgi:signal transduction histidine kinase